MPRTRARRKAPFQEAAFDWKVSHGGKGYRALSGSFKPTRSNGMCFARQYDNALMPHLVFFHRGYAVRKLGRPASHGCIRLHPDNAADFCALVEAFGPANTSIVIAD